MSVVNSAYIMFVFDLKIALLIQMVLFAYFQTDLCQLFEMFEEYQ